MKSRQLETNPSIDLNQQGRVIASHDDIAAVRSRIAKAERDRDTWKMAGSKEKYLEAYFLVEALELQLDERLRTLRPSCSALKTAGRSRRTDIECGNQGRSNQVASDDLRRVRVTLASGKLDRACRRRPRR